MWNRSLHSTGETILIGKLPFRTDYVSATEQIIQGKVQFIDSSFSATSLVKNLLVVGASRRASIEEIFQDNRLKGSQMLRTTERLKKTDSTEISNEANFIEPKAKPFKLQSLDTIVRKKFSNFIWFF
ncbi:hypothetical protein GQX74_009282 [Glossina fuscipes]|nr:hypothetical protein GQX74_009282 [Glossina fuscipes]